MEKAAFLFVLISVLSFSQQKNIKITDLQPKSEDYVFPVVSYSGKPSVENKINTFLQVSELEFIPGTGKNPFTLASTAANSYTNYVYFYNWEKIETPKNILSISMEGEASGAYPESFSDYKNFDLRTGNYINIQDLFQPNAVGIIEKILNQKVEKRIKDYLAELTSSKDDSEDVKDQIAMYEECLGSVNSYTLEYVKFFFGKNGLTIVRERCSNHAMRALDDLGSYNIELPYTELEKYWSPYAKNLLSGAEKAVFQPTPQNTLYRGKIDHKYPVVVLIKQIYEDGSFSAVYWYEKNKKLIEWGGTIKNNHISMIENDYHSEELKAWIPKALIEADVKGNKIIGTWQDYETKKFLNLELEEY
ncbi:hypothetical protein M2347_000680 [Chryseobacterium sp. H1D6B]|uniref:hypothetical protein n=1 Tax=Chryseobacterium sp. H1D6B TaxID=2940588 RepID=UPI0015C72BCF|nr:hypothetical protein [Chryseobacterium sp. H1D6B]MDH6250953.1 hypothetical protein [Chryseobacterium sp. H1D6B]